MGIERAVMIIKGIDDIRILYDTREQIQKQMGNLLAYKTVSNQPSIKRDLSIAVYNDITEEELCEKIMDILPEEEKLMIESIEVIQTTLYVDLPPIAKDRLGMNENQKNILLRIVLRDLVRTLESKEANDIYTKIYSHIHEGSTGYSI